MSNKVNLRNIVPGGASTSVVSPITTTFEGAFAGEYIAAAILSGNTLSPPLNTIDYTVPYFSFLLLYFFLLNFLIKFYVLVL